MGPQWGTHSLPENQAPCLEVDCCNLGIKVWLCARLSLSMWSNAKVGHVVYDNQALEELWRVWHLQTGSFGGLKLKLWNHDGCSIHCHVCRDVSGW